MKKSHLVVLIAMISLLLSSCFDSTSSDPKLNQPTDFTITQQDLTEFVLNWSENSKKEDGYKIERKFDNEAWQEIADLDENTDTYLDDISVSRENWEMVYYKVYSYEGDDTSLPAEANTAIDFPAPTNLTATYSNDILLEWTDNSDGEEGFVIERKKNTEEYQVIATTAANIAIYVDSDVQAENIYYYKVSAFVGDFQSSTSNEVMISTQSNPLMADFEADVTSGFATLTVNFSDLSTGNVISWEWDFGNGESSSEQNPTVQYTEAGTYTVGLTVYDGIFQHTEIKENYITVEESAGIFQDGFENYDDFAIDFSPWTNVDVDGANTYGMTGTAWPNAYDPQAFIIFNPAETVPPVTDADPYNGDKYAACFSSASPTYQNDDWLITPQISLGNGNILSFMAKSYTDEWGLERFNVCVSTTGTDPSDFTIISDGPYLEAPTAWTNFSFDLSDYDGQQVYLAIQCVSADAFFLMIDDVLVSDGTDFIPTSSPVVNGRNVKTEK
ncbi:MAG: choice-of-anchor J domain-containing protein [Candidatus Cloacimonetes bacterium]|nr:choice-of-anchor J domain-containing protein [Candidatus Cloacimonadota bacterium]MCF7814865.1 choice-of-anchor J domain-containing protein [Candidatus Cloacimonadota bacterium]MCF7867947.1 choice-of-anchor J domain-containing protein [Candidatus Cloacimonadota bacterium]MCF7883405.1 choice-of-anchor J domain-containing protein [Candidatus Cloacimonadota bacterium]